MKKIKAKIICTWLYLMLAVMLSPNTLVAGDFSLLLKGGGVSMTGAEESAVIINEGAVLENFPLSRRDFTGRKFGFGFEIGLWHFFALQLEMNHIRNEVQYEDSAEAEPVSEQALYRPRKHISKYRHSRRYNNYGKRSEKTEVYFQMPLWLKLRLLQKQKFGLYLAPGVFYAINITAEDDNLGSSPNQFTFVINGSNTKNYLGVGGLLGFQYYFNHKFKIFFEASYLAGLVNIYRFDNALLFKNSVNNSEFYLGAGIGFTWGREQKKPLSPNKTEKAPAL